MLPLRPHPLPYTHTQTQTHPCFAAPFSLSPDSAPLDRSPFKDLQSREDASSLLSLWRPKPDECNCGSRATVASISRFRRSFPMCFFVLFCLLASVCLTLLTYTRRNQSCSALETCTITTWLGEDAPPPRSHQRSEEPLLLVGRAIEVTTVCP